ncbi:hypothetical protein MHU86_8333 [Fragilaria crotonensis]|nr:hypothetical protein MHU86_8333 [Fragilaria crotonensis]
MVRGRRGHGRPIDGIAEAQRLLLDLGPRRDTSRAGQVDPHRPLATPPPALAALAEFNFRHEEGTATWAASWDRAPPRRMGGPQVQQWIEGVHCLAAAARRYPQTAYAGLSQSLQAEWQYLQRVTPDIAPAFAPLEAAIATVFLPALLATTVEEVAKLALLALPTRLGGLGIPDPTTTGDFCFAASKESTTSSRVLVTGDRLCATEHRRRFRGRLAAKASRSRVKQPPRSCELATDWRSDASYGRRRPAPGSPAEPAQRLRPLGRRVPRRRPPPLRPDANISPTPMRRMRRTLHDGARHVLSQGGLILHRHNDLVATWGQLCGQAHTLHSL